MMANLLIKPIIHPYILHLCFNLDILILTFWWKLNLFVKLYVEGSLKTLILKDTSILFLVFFIEFIF